VASHESEETKQLRARVNALEQLLEVHERAVIGQAEQLERTVVELRQYTEQLTRSQQILREGEERYRQLFESNPHPMWVYDLETLAFLAVNNAAVSHYGYAREEFLGMTIRDIRPAEDIPALMQRVAAVKDGLDVAGIWRHRKKDGTIIDVEVTSHTLMFGGRRAEVVLAHDVTERNRAEEAIRASEERYRTILSSALDGFWILDMKGRILEVNDAYCRMIGYSRTELLAMGIADLDIEESPAQTRDHIRWIKEQGGDRFEARHRAKDGRVLDVEVSVRYVDRDGGRLFAFFRDITARKQAELALRESEEQFILFMDNLTGFAWIKDFNGRYVYINRHHQTVLNMPPDWRGKTDWDFFSKEIATHFVGNDRRVLETGREVHAIETFVLKDGLHYALVSKFPIRRPMDHQMFVGGVAIDITERMRAEEALQASEERFKVFMNNSPAVAFMKDEEGRHVYVNEPLARLFQKSQAELIGKTDFEILPVEIATQLRENDRLVMAGDKVIELQETMPDADGRPHHWMVFKFPFREASGRRLLAGMAIDITDRKQLEEQLRQAQKMEAIGRLAGGVAHDFNNLLTVISGYSELLQYRLATDQPLHKYAEHIKEAGDRATALTRQLLAFSRQQVLRPVVLDLNRAVQDVMQMLQRLIGEHIDLRVHLAPAPTFIKADPGQIEQVLLNLVLNARDAMPEGGRLTIETVNLELEEAASQRLGTAPGPCVQLTVTDTGCGMDVATQGRIFEPFFTTKDLGKGTGLGLATVYGIVMQSRGAITVDTAPGQGARFTIYFPKSDVVADDRETNQSRNAEPVIGSETILVVEDQDSVRGFLRNLLRLYGYDVLEASGGSEAIAICEEHAGKIDLLVTDVVMPGMSGRELAERIGAEQPAIKVLLISGYTDDPSIQTGGAQGGLAFLQKPFSPITLTQRIREVLDQP
jgi:PAS domain S-box-containing protein